MNLKQKQKDMEITSPSLMNTVIPFVFKVLREEPQAHIGILFGICSAVASAAFHKALQTSIGCCLLTTGAYTCGYMLSRMSFNHLEGPLAKKKKLATVMGSVLALSFMIAICSTVARGQTKLFEKTNSSIKIHLSH